MFKQTLIAVAIASVSTGAMAYGGAKNSNDYNTNYSKNNHGYVGQIDGNHNEQWVGDDWSTNVDVNVDQSHNDYGDRHNGDYVENNYYGDITQTNGGTHTANNGGDHSTTIESGNSNSVVQDPSANQQFAAPPYATYDQLKETEQNLNAGIASAIAIGSHAWRVGNNAPVQVSIAGGYYQSESAVSLGIGGQMTERTFISGSVGHDSQGNTAAGMAINWQL